MADQMFNSFDPVSFKQWKQKIQVDLKGADFNETLVTATNEGIAIQPAYHKENFKSLPIDDSDGTFKICQSVFIHQESKANHIALDAIGNGAEVIRFQSVKKFNINQLLNGFSKEQDVAFIFELDFLDQQFVDELCQASCHLEAFIKIDLINHLTSSGNWFISNKEDHQTWQQIVLKNNNYLPVADVRLYQNAGANMVQQLAYALAHLNEYFNFFEENNFHPQKMMVQWAVGSHYFFEIAKLRAFKYLWSELCKTFNIECELVLFTEPSSRNKSIFDYNVNMLRTTTECMSAIIGGAQMVENKAYDDLFHKKNPFGERISRNQLIILQQESAIENAAYAKGSYFIEDLTYQLVQKALVVFKDVEKGGGFVSQLFKGSIQRKIKESAAKEQEQFNKNDLKLLGVNHQENPNDKMKDDLELYPFQKRNITKTVIEPILAKRLAEEFEQQRIAQES